MPAEQGLTGGLLGFATALVTGSAPYRVVDRRVLLGAVG
jgi:hypothetical protein